MDLPQGGGSAVLALLPGPAGSIPLAREYGEGAQEVEVSAWRGLGFGFGFGFGLGLGFALRLH